MNTSLNKSIQCNFHGNHVLNHVTVAFQILHARPDSHRTYLNTALKYKVYFCAIIYFL